MASFSRNPGPYLSSESNRDEQSDFQQYLNDFERDGTSPPIHSAGTWPQDSTHNPSLSERRPSSARTHGTPNHLHPATTGGLGDESVNNSTTQLTPPAIPTVQVTALVPNAQPAAAQLLPPAHAGPLVEKKRPTPKGIILNWKWEILTAILAIGILVCEIVLLVHYDHKFLFEYWSHTWKINSVFAFLTTLLEVSIMFFIGACIGQLRWHWYRKHQHRLDWLEIMTDAQRPSGAMRLLFRRGSHKQFAIFGALIVIFLLGVSTFTQQVITEVIKDFPLGPPGPFTGFVPINTNYTWKDTTTTVGIGTQQPLPGMVAAIQDGFYSFSTAGGGLLSAQAYTACYGDSCDFGKYQSIGVCSRCVDVSKNVVNPCLHRNCTEDDYFFLKSGVNLTLLATRGEINVTADTEYPTDPALASAVGPLIVRFHALVPNHAGNNQTGASATECAAWWCVKTYNSTMVNGTLHEDIIDHWTDKSETARTQYRQTNDIILQPPQCLVNDTRPTNQSFCNFYASAYSQVALQNFLTAPDPSLPFKPFLTGSAVFYNHPSGESTFNATSLLALGLISATSVKRAIMSQVHYGFHAMADQMTVSIRGALTNTYGSEYSYGTAYLREQQFHVRWGWIAYPIAILVAALIFFVITIWMTRKDEAWKGSILPVIYHSFGGDDQAEFVKLDTVSDMKKASRARKVSLATTKGHAALKAHQRVQEHHGKHGRHGKVHEMTQTMAAGVGKAGEIYDQST